MFLDEHPGDGLGGLEIPGGQVRPGSERLGTVGNPEAMTEAHDLHSAVGLSEFQVGTRQAVS
jgi:hypothetical protein